MTVQTTMAGALIVTLALIISAFASAQERYTLHADLAYGDDPKQVMDIYQPANALSSPVLFMVHGGGWRVGDKQNKGFIDNKLKRWSERGFVVVSVNYRLMPAADPKLQADDIAQALHFAQQEAFKYGGDPKRFVLLGHSAGAHLVGLIAADPSWAGSAGVEPWLGAILLDSAAMNVPQLMAQQRLNKIYKMAFGTDPEYWQQVSPLQRLTAQAKPFLLVCSENRDYSCAQAHGFIVKASTLGVSAKLLTVSYSHRDVSIKLGEANDYTDKVEQFLAELNPEISERLALR